MRARRRRSAALAGALLVAICLLVTGCWDRLELEKRGNVIALGVDPGGAGLYVTAQFAIPGAIPLGPGAGQGTGAGATPRQTVFVQGATGPTLQAALTSVQHTIENEVFLGHVRVIVISESLARQGISNALDYLIRDPEVRRTAWLVVSATPAADAINLSPALGRVPGLFLTDMMEHFVNLGVLPLVYTGTIVSRIHAQGEDAIAPYVYARGQGVRLLGAAVFQDGRMVDTIDTAQLSALEDVIGPVKSAQHLTVPEPGTANGQVRLHILNRHASVRPSVVDGRPQIDIRIRMEASIVEETNAASLKRSGALQAVAEAAEQIVRQQVDALVARTQRDQADIFGFGAQVRAKKPRWFAAQMSTKSWDTEVYPQLTVRTQVKILVIRVGSKER